jgi:hypothetical protein
MVYLFIYIAWKSSHPKNNCGCVKAKRDSSMHAPSYQLRCLTAVFARLSAEWNAVNKTYRTICERAVLYNARHCVTHCLVGRLSIKFFMVRVFVVVQQLDGTASSERQKGWQTARLGPGRLVQGFRWLVHFHAVLPNLKETFKDNSTVWLVQNQKVMFNLSLSTSRSKQREYKYSSIHS